MTLIMHGYKGLSQLYLCIILLSLIFASECTFFHFIHIRPKQTCKKNCCAKVKCPALNQTMCHPNQMVKPHAGWCGCCPKCMTQLKEGASCKPKPKCPVPRMPTSECGCGMKCVQRKCCKH